MDYHDKTRKKYSSAVLKEQHMPPAAICGGGPSCETLRIISAPTLLTRAEPLQRSLGRCVSMGSIMHIRIAMLKRNCTSTQNLAIHMFLRTAGVNLRFFYTQK